MTYDPYLDPDPAKMNRQQKIDHILFAIRYRSGNDSCNSVYMGWVQRYIVMANLGGDFLKDTFEAACIKASDKSISAALEECKFVLGYADTHPVTTCECCGQIRPVNI